MICLTRLNGQPLAINSDLIKFAENAPDTVLTLVNGEKVLVRESTAEVMDRIIAFRRAVIGMSASQGIDAAPTAAANAGLRADLDRAQQVKEKDRG